MICYTSLGQLYIIFSTFLYSSEDVRGVDVAQDLNLHPIKAVPEYCRLWAPLPDVSEELTKISEDFS